MPKKVLSVNLFNHRPGTAAWKLAQRRRRDISNEMLRRTNRFRELVVRMIRAGEVRPGVLGLNCEHPDRKDVAAALREIPANPQTAVPAPTKEEWALLDEQATADAWRGWQSEISQERRAESLAAVRKQIADDTATLCAYVANYYVEGKPRKKPKKEMYRRDIAIARFYYDQLKTLEAARKTKAGAPRNVKTIADQNTMAEYNIKKSRLKAILQDIKLKERPETK